MKEKCTKVLVTVLIGILFIIIGGFIFHELYDNTGQKFLIGLISPVNESKWEHWKIAFIPFMIYGIIEYIFIKKEANNFLFAKAIGVLSFILVTFGLIELYEVIFGEAHLWLHVTTFILGAIAGQIISYIIMIRSRQFSNGLDVIGLFIILVIFILLIVFTLWPPKVDYFRDSIDGTYGIYKETIE